MQKYTPLKEKCNRKCNDKITKEDMNVLPDNYRDVMNTTGEIHLLVN
jgi:hypothetical protein